MGAPIRGFTRISDEPVRLHCAIDEPDIIVVLDDTLLDTVDVCEGLPDNGVVIINTGKDSKAIRDKISWNGKQMYVVNASEIALDEMGRPIPNTPMLGALIKVSEMISLEVLLEDITAKFSKKFKKQIVEGNLRAINRAYKEVHAA